MNTLFVGIDAAAESFCAAIWQPELPVENLNDLPNSPEGYQRLRSWLAEHQAEKALICVENTGVYSERMLYWLHHAGLRLWLESPQKIARAFRLPQKSDPSDARQIAEYCYRYQDQCQLWQPNAEIVEQINVLLSSREQLQGQLTANRNVLRTLERKVVQTPGANQVLQALIVQLGAHITEIERQIRALIDSNSQIGSTIALLMSVPGVGLLLASNLAVLTRGFSQLPDAKNLASYLGICPHEHSSGTSVYRRPRSSGFGPSRMRKLLYLSSMTLKRNDEHFGQYYDSKRAEGKAGRLVLNNIANKLLRIVCAVLRSRTPYNASYRSVHPRFNALPA